MHVASDSVRERVTSAGAIMSHHHSNVPSSATCESAVRVLVAADRLTLVHGVAREVLGGIEMAGPGYLAPAYRDFMAVLITEFRGDQPVIAIFKSRHSQRNA